MRPRATLVPAVLAAVVATAPAHLPPPHLPPLAFRTATLVRVDRTIEIRLSAASQVGVRVVVSRGAVRLGSAGAGLSRGTTAVPVPIGPKGIRPLRKGLHVDVAIYYGPADPVRAHPALLLGQGAGPPPPITA